MASGGSGNRGPREVSDPSNVQIKRSATGTVKTEAANSNFYSKSNSATVKNCHADLMQTFNEFGIVPMNESQDSLDKSGSGVSIRMKKMTRIYDGSTKFPKLEECAHFHYDFVELGPLQVAINVENQENQYRGSGEEQRQDQQFYITVNSNECCWTIRRTYENFRSLDKQLHRCIFDRKYSLLPELRRNEVKEEGVQALKKQLALYLHRFSSIAGNMINCGPILSWLEMDNRGNRLIVTDDSAINTPAVAAGHVTKRYNAQAPDEISFEVGDIISLIDIPPAEESAWWRGKKGFEVGFFPAECVEVIGDKIPASMTSQIPETPPKPVLRKRGKLISFLRAFFSTRPARTQLKRSGIVKERVFGCDLGEHLLNSGLDVPLVLKCCGDVIETHGIQDGIYRLSGVSSNIQKLRNDFDEDRIPDLTSETYMQDIHSISSLLKMYFRELPNPLFTYQLYDKFAAAIQEEEGRLVKIHDVVQQLPPPHYRTAEYLMKHLARVAAYGKKTGMHCKNLAIVWAPNLLRSKDLEQKCTTAALQGVGIQAIVTEFMISYADIIFSDSLQHANGSGGGNGSLRRGRPKSLAISTPTKLLSLEEARERALSTSTVPSQKYIDVGGGPSNLPEKYHTVIDVKKGKGSKDRKSPVSGWRSIFNRTKTHSFSKRDTESLSSAEGAMAMSSEDHSSPFRHSYEGAEAMTEHEMARRRQLRTVRSADSLTSGTSGQLSGGAEGCFVNPYTDEYQRVRPKSATLERMKGTKRSISCDNSYSGSDVDVFPEPEEEYDRNSKSLDGRSKKGKGKGKNKSELVAELETRISMRSNTKSPKKGKSPSKNRSLSSEEAATGGATGGLTKSPSAEQYMLHPSPPGVPKRSRSMGYDHHEALPCFSVPAPPRPRSQVPMETSPSFESDYYLPKEPPPSQRDPFSSFGKKKKSAAPTPPVVPTPPSVSPQHESVLSQSAPNVSSRPGQAGRADTSSSSDMSLELDHYQAAPRARHDPLSPIGEMIPVELSESPGAKRKLLSRLSQNLEELEESGMEGAHCEMASYDGNLTDEDLYQQHLSVNTDSDAELDNRESMSQLDLSTDHKADLALSSEGQSEGEALASADEDMFGHMKPTLHIAQSKSLGILPQDVQSSPPYGEERVMSACYDTLQSERSMDFDLVSEMSKSLDSLLRTAAGSDVYISCDDAESDKNQRKEKPVQYESTDTNAAQYGSSVNDSATDNYTNSSELQFSSSNSMNDSDFQGAELYAESLTPTPQSAGYIPRRRDRPSPPDTTESDSDYGGVRKTPTNYIESTVQESSEGGVLSDSETEIALLAENYKDRLAGANIPIGYSSTEIDLSETDVPYVDPHEDREIAWAASQVTKGIDKASDILQDNYIPEGQLEHQRESSNSQHYLADTSSSEDRSVGEFDLPKGESGRIVIRKPIPESPEGQPQQAQKVRVTPPHRMVAKAAAPPLPQKQDSGIASGDSLGDSNEKNTMSRQKAVEDIETDHVIESPMEEKSDFKFSHGMTGSQYGDGYLADRSSSTSPTFSENKNKKGKKKAILHEQSADIEVAINNEQDKKLEITMEPLKEEGESQTRDMISPGAREGKRGSTDSGLIFEMDDINQEPFKKADSRDKLNMSCDSDDIFRDGSTAANHSSIHSELKMATSSSPDIPSTGMSMATSEELLEITSDVNMATPPSPPHTSTDKEFNIVKSSSSEFVVRSGMSKERNTPQRKKSVKELLSKFESANSPPLEDVKSKPVYQRPRVVKVKMVSPTSPESDTPFETLSSSMECYADERILSTSAPAPRTLESPQIEVKSLISGEKSPPPLTLEKPSLDRGLDELSTSPKITDRIKCFESPSSGVDSSTDSDILKPIVGERTKPRYSPIAGAMTRSLEIPASSGKETGSASSKSIDMSKIDNTSESDGESASKPILMLPHRTTRSRGADQGVPRLSLAERMRCLQESAHLSSSKSSTEREESLSPLHITESDSNSTDNSSKLLTLSTGAEPKRAGPAKDSRFPIRSKAEPVRLSDKRKMFESFQKEKSPDTLKEAQDDFSHNRSLQPEKPEEAHVQPRGSFQRRFTKTEPEPAVLSHTESDETASDRYSSLSERRKKFEILKREEAQREEKLQDVKSNDNVKKSETSPTIQKAESSVDNVLAQRARQYGAKTIFLETGDKDPKGSDQTEKSVDNAVSRQGTAANKENIKNNNEKPRSVRDLSRQFERQHSQPGPGDSAQGQFPNDLAGGARRGTAGTNHSHQPDTARPSNYRLMT